MKPVVLKLREDAKTPTKRQADAGYDLYTVWDEPIVVHEPFTTMVFPTGLKMRFPHTHVALFRERGSTGIHNIQVRAGVVEGNYSGEYKVLLNNGNSIPMLYARDGLTTKDLRKPLENRIFWLSPNQLEIKKDSFGRQILFDTETDIELAYIYPQSKAIAQMVFTKKEDWEFEDVSEEEFNSIETDRGEGWNGSTGK